MAKKASIGFALALAVSAPHVGMAYASQEQPTDGQYIVLLDDTATITDAVNVAADAQRAGATIADSVRGAVDGYVITATATEAARLRGLDNVAAVVPDAPVTLEAVQLPAPSWGLDRIDGKTGDGYRYGLTGQGVTIYVIDTGVSDRSNEFTNRLRPGYNAVNDGFGTADCNGHGTVVASIAAGTTYGVAKGATVVPVRTMNCDGEGDSSDVIDGINWIIANHPAGTPGIINMSLSTPANGPLATAVRRAIDSGFTVVAAAGNSNSDACNLTPANVPEALTVAASTSSDSRARFSNHGTCVDVFAPGERVISASNTRDAAVSSGTSMAAPHAAGVAAQLLQSNPAAAPAETINTLLRGATPNVLTEVAGSPNLLVQVPGDSTSPQPEPTLPAIEKGTNPTATATVSKPNRRLASAPTATAPLEEAVSISATGVPVKKGQRVTVDIRVDGTWVRWGTPTVRKTETVRIGSVKVNTPGVYPMRLVTPAATVYVKIQAG